MQDLRDQLKVRDQMISKKDNQIDQAHKDCRKHRGAILEEANKNDNKLKMFQSKINETRRKEHLQKEEDESKRNKQRR